MRALRVNWPKRKLDTLTQGCGSVNCVPRYAAGGSARPAGSRTGAYQRASQAGGT